MDIILTMNITQTIPTNATSHLVASTDSPAKTTKPSTAKTNDTIDEQGEATTTGSSNSNGSTGNKMQGDKERQEVESSESASSVATAAAAAAAAETGTGKDNDEDDPSNQDDEMEPLSDSYEAQENVHNAVMVDPDPGPDHQVKSNLMGGQNCSSILNSETECGDNQQQAVATAAIDDSPAAAAATGSDQPADTDGGGGGGSGGAIERRAFKPSSLLLMTDEIRKQVRAQGNKLLLGPNLKMKRKRKHRKKKASGGGGGNEGKTSSHSQTRQGGPVATIGYGTLQPPGGDWAGASGGGGGPVAGASNQITSTIKQHLSTLSNPLNLSSTVQKLIMGKLVAQQQQQQQQQQKQHHHQKPFNLDGSVFYQQANSGYQNHHQQVAAAADLLNQWASSDTSASYAQSGSSKAKQQQQQQQGSPKLIPIEIIGLDPMITKSILETNSAALDGGAQSALTDMGQQQAASTTGGGFKSHDRPTMVPSSIVHIHHFHTQAKAAAAAAAAKQQQLQAGSLDESNGQQQVSAETGGLRGENSPQDVHIVNPQTHQPASNISGGGSLQQSNRPVGQQQVYFNDRGEMVYLPANDGDGTGIIDSTTQSALNGQLESQHDGQQQQQQQEEPGSASEDYNKRYRQFGPATGGGGDTATSSQQDKLTGESVNPVHQATNLATNGSQMVPPIHHEGHNHSTAYLMQPFSRAAGQQVASSLAHNMIFGGPPTDSVEQPQRRQRVFLTTNGQTISLVSNGQSHQINQVGADDQSTNGDYSNNKMLMVAYKPQMQQQRHQLHPPPEGKHLGQFRNITGMDSDLFAGANWNQNPYNEGQESKASMISANSAAQQLLLKGAANLFPASSSYPPILANHHQNHHHHHHQHQVPIMFNDNELFDSDLAITRPNSTSGSLANNQRSAMTNWSNNYNKFPSLPGYDTLNGRAKLSGQLAQARAQHADNINNRVPSNDPNNIGNSNNNNKGSGDVTTSFRATWLPPISEMNGSKQHSNGYEASNNYTLSTLLKQQNNSQLVTQLPAQVISMLRLSLAANNTLTNEELLRRLLQEIKLKNNNNSNGLSAASTPAIQGLNFDPNNKRSFNHSTGPVAVDKPIPMMKHNLASIKGGNGSSNDAFHTGPMQKIVTNPSNLNHAIKNHYHQNKFNNNMLEPLEISGGNGGAGLQAQAKQRQPTMGVVAMGEEADFGDTTNGLSNIALAFIFVVSLITLTIIAVSMIYRYRRRSIGRCADLPTKSRRLNLTQRTKRFVRSNFSGPNHNEAASIKSINLDFSGTNSLNRDNSSAPGRTNRKEASSSSTDGAAHKTPNTVGGNCRAIDRYTFKQPFGNHHQMITNLSTFNGTIEQQFKDNPNVDIKTLNTKLQKSNYLRSMISPTAHECSLATTNHSHPPGENRKQQQQQQQQTPIQQQPMNHNHHQHQHQDHHPHHMNSNRTSANQVDSSCYLTLTHGTENFLRSPKSRAPPPVAKCKSSSVADDCGGRSQSFNKKKTSPGSRRDSSCHENYSFTCKSPPSEQRHNNKNGKGGFIDSRNQPTRMSTIHSMSETSDHQQTKSTTNNNGSANVLNEQFTRHPNASCMAGRLTHNPMAPKHVVAPMAGFNTMNDSCTRPTELEQIDRL